jgi:hypothetical protein
MLLPNVLLVLLPTMPALLPVILLSLLPVLLLLPVVLLLLLLLLLLLPTLPRIRTEVAELHSKSGSNSRIMARKLPCLFVFFPSDFNAE